jgi:DNA-binding response OmpR family regulator
MKRAILVIEDEKAMRLLVQEFLELLGYRVLTAPDGKTAIRLGVPGEISMAFVDINLPDMSGIEVMERLRSSGVDSPFVVVSANLRESFADKITTLRVNEVLEKPVDLTTLEALVKRLIGEASSPRT